MIAWQIWLIISGFFFILEILTVGFLVFWFGVSALITCLLSLFITNIIAQTAIFVVLSAILVFLTRPLAEKLSKKDNTKTNINTIIGKEAIVKKAISKNENGQIKLDGDIWTAVLDNDYSDCIPEGSIVEILKIDGVKVIVKPIKIIELSH